MKKIISALYISILFCLAFATYLERYSGTFFASNEIYSSSWFHALWLVLVLAMCVYFFKRRVFKINSIGLLHFSFVIILLGAFVTHVDSKQGVIHLRQKNVYSNHRMNVFCNQEMGKEFLLPFSLSLDTFIIKSYPSTSYPVDYISKISVCQDSSVRGVVSMNNIFSYKGYRFYQRSFDDDLKGSWLSVNYDPWGTLISYIGYFIFVASSIWMLFSVNGRFKRLLRHPLLKKSILIFLLFCSATTNARTVSVDFAESYRSKQIYYNERITVFNTLARDFVFKLTGKAKYKDLTSEQVLLSCLCYSKDWQYEPMIKIDNQELQKMLGCGINARLVDFFDKENQSKLEKINLNSYPEGQRKSLLKAISQSEEKLALFEMLHNGALIKYLPLNAQEGKLSSLKVKAELLYNDIPFVQIICFFNLSVGAIFLFFQWMKHSLFYSRKYHRIITFAIMISFLFHTIGLLLRIYISARLPMSNGYETMQFLAWIVLGIGLFMNYRLVLFPSIAFILSGIILFVSHLAHINPQITPLIPVLSSPLLSLHVSLIMISYAFLGFIFFNGITAIIYHFCDNKMETKKLFIVSQILLYPAILFLGTGIFVGAIWANLTWGRYWGWDPKEVWALITFMVYGAAFHLNGFKRFRRPIFFHLFLVIAFTTVLMTYFGVNYLLGGMHSYGIG